MIPATATGRSASAITSSSDVSLRSVPSSVRIVSPVARAADDDPALGELRVVERVQRVAEREHDVVRHVDDVRDRAHPRAEQPRLQPGRRLADANVAEEPADVARAPLEVLDADVDRLVARDRLGTVPRAGRKVDVEQRRDLAGDAVDRRQVGPVVAGLDLEHRVGERQHVGERRARLVRGVEEHDPGVVGAEVDLVLGEDHPVGDLAAHLAPLELEPVRRAPRRAARPRRSRRRRSSTRRRRSGAARPRRRRPSSSCSRSAFGCFSASSTRPTRKRPRLPSASGTPRRTTRSTSQLVNTSRRASSSTGRSNATYSRSQETGTFIRTAPARAGRCPRTGAGRAGRGGASRSARSRARTRSPTRRRGRSRRCGRRAGSTQPAPPISIQPECLHTGQPWPSQMKTRHVELDRRLGEREVARPHAHLALGPEQRAEELEHVALEVGERDAAVDDEALDLEERRRVRRVGRVAAVAAAGHDRVDRRLPRLHQPDLVRRRVRAQQHVVAEIERVGRRARRMAAIGRERVEVVPDVGHLVALVDLVAHAEEDVLDLAPDLRQEVQPAALRPSRRAASRRSELCA